MFRNDFCLFTILVFDGVILLQLFGNLIISLANISPASVRVCVLCQALAVDR